MNITLYAQDEKSWFAVRAVNKWKQPIVVDVMADDEKGAYERACDSAKDYDLSLVATPNYVATSDEYREFSR